MSECYIFLTIWLSPNEIPAIKKGCLGHPYRINAVTATLPVRLLIQAQMFFGVGFEISTAANVFFINKDLWHGFNRFTDRFFQISFGNAFGMNVDITEFKIVTLRCQFLS
ncbi:hypothetical [Yersinia pestis KIM10+]|uniref:Uncharacterized protein n=1 Tax=Yersinia pestis TaxID=632 RepID=Q8CKU1_YERPE|nr:hypothetical [Yersinia pestis KIM10+]